MRMIMIALAIGMAVFGAAYLLVNGRSGDAAGVAAGPSYVQRDRGEGGVEIEVTYVIPEYLKSGGRDAQRYEPKKYTVFLVAMNTHSVDLGGYDLTKVSEVRVGGKILAPLRWVSTADNSHHRSGALLFPKVNPALPVELVIKTIAGVPSRTFRWSP